MFPDNLTRDEAMARSAALQTQSYEVEVDLTGRAVTDPELTFVSTSVARFSAEAPTATHIDLIAERVISATLNGVELDPATFANSRLRFEAAAGDNELQVQAECRFSRSGLGLHRFVDPADQRIYLYTQFEVSEARRMYACFEQPDLKATFAISVLAPSDWTVIATSAGDDPTPLDDQFSRWNFPATPPISTYITGLVAGQYHQVSTTFEARESTVPMSILCRQSMVDHLDADRIFATTQGGFKIFEEHFGIPYPFGKYDQAFVPEYNMGAMENVGCVVLRDDYIFRSRVTQAAYDGRDNTILHELAHMWFGDLVTMTWWDDLWLKESFAEWAAQFAQSQLDDDHDRAWATFCNARKTWAYRQDQLPSTHPIAADMVDLEAVELNFDGITYAKGASALQQLVAFVGRDAFLEGVRAYFAIHAYGNTKLTDLLQALEKPSGRDLSGWSAEWLETAGVNTIRAQFETDSEGAFTSFAVEQSAAADWPTLRHHRIAIGLYSLDGEQLTRTDRIEVDIAGASTDLPELIGKQQPDLILLNDDDLSYAKVRLDPRSLQTVIAQIAALQSPLPRAVSWGATWDMCRDAEMLAGDYVELVLGGIAVESDLTAVGALLRQAQRAASEYTAPANRDAVLARWETGLADLLSTAAAGSDHQLAFARALAQATNSVAGVDRLVAWLAGTEVPEGLTIDADLRWTFVIELARLGRIDEAAIDAELAADSTITGAEHAAQAKASRPTAEAKAAAWALAVDGDETPNETQRSICTGFWQAGQDEALAGYEERYFAAAEEISAARGVWATKGLSLRNNVLALLFPAIATQELVDTLDRWLASTELTDPVRRVIYERRDDTVRALRCQAAASSTTS